MVVCMLWVLCVVMYRVLRRAYLSCRRILPTVVCLSMISKHPQRRPLGLSSHEKFWLPKPPFGWYISPAASQNWIVP
jgi:hypothetical protein